MDLVEVYRDFWERGVTLLSRRLVNDKIHSYLGSSCLRSKKDKIKKNEN